MSNDFNPNFSSMDFTWHSFPWTLLYLIFNSTGIYLTWYAMNLPQLIFNNLYGRLLSVGFTFDCLQWTYLRHTPIEFYLRLPWGDLGRNSTNFTWDCLQYTIHEIISSELCRRWCSKDCNCADLVHVFVFVCVSGLMYYLAHTRLHQWRRCGFHNECDEEIVKCRT